MTQTTTRAPAPVFGSYSALVAHRTCPQQWVYSYMRRLRRVESEPAIALHFGSWWHAVRAADALKRGRAAGTLHHAPDRITSTDDGPTFANDAPVSAVIQGARGWYARQSEEYRAAAEAYLGEPIPQRLTHLYLAWHARWRDDLANEAPLAVEMLWRKVLPAADIEDGTPLHLGGAVDEVYFDTKRQMVVVRDHKTGQSLDRTHTDVLLDSQTHLYDWGIAETVESWGYGPVRAVAYDRARSVAPKPPSLTKSGRLAVRGGQPSIASTDLATYLAWAAGPEGNGVPFEGLKKDGSGAGTYVAEESIIERLSTPEEQARWFQRSLTPLNRNIQALHLEAAQDGAADIVRTKVRVERSGYAQRNFGRECRWCDFAKLCAAEMVGGPGDYPPEDYGLEAKPRSSR